MATNKMFVFYSKTKAEFISAGLPTTYNNSIVFIKGDANGNGSCIYTHGVYFSNFAEMIAAINYIKGVNVGGTNYNAAAGGGYLAFSASDPSTVAVNAGQNGITIGLTSAFVNKVNNTATNLGAGDDAAKADGSAFARIADLAAKLGALTGDTSGSVGSQITEAINALRTEIVGTLSEGDSATLAAVNDELDSLVGQSTALANRVKAIEDDYLKAADKTALTNTISGVSNRVKTIEDDYLKKADKDALAANIKAISDDYLKAADKTELANRITNEAPVSMSESAGTGDILKTYTFTQNGKEIGKINLAKDLVVSGGQIVVNDGVKYLQLTIANQAAPVLIPVSDLVDVYTGSAYVSISDKNVISVDKAGIIAGLATTASVNQAIADEVTRAEAAYDAKGDAAKAQAAAEAKAKDLADAAEAAGVNAATTKAAAAESAAKAYADTHLATAKTYAEQKAQAAENAACNYANSLAGNYATAEQGAKADAAAPQATTYTKAQVDAMWAWEEL